MRNFIFKPEQFLSDYGDKLYEYVTTISPNDTSKKVAECFGNYLKTERLFAGFSSEAELAQKVGIPEGDVFALEQGLISPEKIDFTHLVRLAEALDEDIKVIAGILGRQLEVPTPNIDQKNLQSQPGESFVFTLEVKEEEGGTYSISVLQSPAGEAKATIVSPFRHLAVNNYLKTRQLVSRTTGGQHQVLLEEEMAIQRYGAKLFNLLFSGEVRDRYDVSRRYAYQQGKGLCFKLYMQLGQMADLPWEFLYDGRVNEYLCLSPNVSFVRYLNREQPIQPLVVNPPLRILGMVASPTNHETLNVGIEKQRLEAALRPLQVAGQVALTWVEGNTWHDLRRAIHSDGPWHIFHFIGLGDFNQQTEDDVLLLEDKSDLNSRASGNYLGTLPHNYPTLRLVFLNACESASAAVSDPFAGVAQHFLRQNIPAVIAMQFEITDRAAITLAQEFYAALADGYSVDTALTEARKALYATGNNLEWGTPVLYMQSSEGNLFAVEQRPDERLRPTPTTPQAIAQLVSQVSPLPSTMRMLEEHIATALRRGLEYFRDMCRNLPQWPLKSVLWRTDTPSTKAVSQQSIAFAWVTIPAGEFIMGKGSEQETVYLPEYWIANVPVTNAQYYRFVEVTNHHSPHYWENDRIPAGKEDHPVVGVSWYEAVTFCRWLMEEMYEHGTLPRDRAIRLPSEAEWEKAARGTDGRIYPWGNESPDSSRCNFGNMIGDTTSIGSYPNGASPYGVLDMAGNVWEWCSTQWLDNYQEYEQRTQDDLADNVRRVVRGGSFRNSEEFIRCTYRTSDNQVAIANHCGFRIVAAPDSIS